MNSLYLYSEQSRVTHFLYCFKIGKIPLGRVVILAGMPQYIMLKGYVLCAAPPAVFKARRSDAMLYPSLETGKVQKIDPQLLIQDIFPFFGDSIHPGRKHAISTPEGYSGPWSRL